MKQITAFYPHYAMARTHPLSSCSSGLSLCNRPDCWCPDNQRQSGQSQCGNIFDEMWDSHSSLHGSCVERTSSCDQMRKNKSKKVGKTCLVNQEHVGPDVANQWAGLHAGVGRRSVLAIGGVGVQDVHPLL